MDGLQHNFSWLSFNSPFQLAAASHRRGRLTALFVVICAALTTTNAAADYPDRPIRVIVPGAPGGGPDVSTRIIVGELTRQMGTQFVVDNRPGASGSMGTELIARAAPDGYTIGQGNFATLNTNRFFLPKLPYDIDRDIQPISLYSIVPNILAVTLSLPVKSVQELVDHARKNPNTLLFASGGVGEVVNPPENGA